jgi:hypothetical protein
LSATSTKKEYNEAIEQYLGKEMVAVAECEGGLKWGAVGYNKDKNTGKVWSTDENTFQVNRKYHYEKALKMGMDIDTITGHFQYVNYLKKHNGLSDWKASRKCWSTKIHQQQLTNNNTK